MWMRSPGPSLVSPLALGSGALGAVAGAAGELAGGADAVGAEGTATAGGEGSASVGLTCANERPLTETATRPATSEVTQDRRTRTGQTYHGAPRSGGRERRRAARAIVKYGLALASTLSS